MAKHYMHYVTKVSSKVELPASYTPYGVLTRISGVNRVIWLEDSQEPDVEHDVYEGQVWWNIGSKFIYYQPNVAVQTFEKWRIGQPYVPVQAKYSDHPVDPYAEEHYPQFGGYNPVAVTVAVIAGILLIIAPFILR